MIVLDEINKDEALRYMGHRGEVPPTLKELVLKCEKQLLEVIRPAYIFKCFDIEYTDGGIRVLNTSLTFKGNDIKNHLEDCSRAVLMCATIGAEADKLIRLTEISDISAAFVMDSLASAAVEQVCSQADNIIKETFPTEFLTWRFSPGYGDFPIEIQRDFLDVMNAQKRIGLNVGSGNILIPRKSVTAVAGLSRTPVPKKRRGCVCCNMAEVCQYRKRGDHCGF